MTGPSTRLLAIAALAVGLAACNDGGSLSVPRHLRPVSAETRALMQDRQMDMRAPILVRIFKSEGQLEVWKQTRNGRYALLRSFEICRWSGDLGPKVREGDRQAPEGFYTVTPALMNPRSSYHLAFNTGFPNAFDRAHNRTGSHLMVHGDCSSRGCFAMTNAQMEEIYALARDAFDGGQRGIQLQILPFRMTAENMFRYRNNPHIAFWRNLQEGSQHFEATGRPPEVQVCGRRYVFNQTPTNPDARFEPTQACPPAEIPTELRVQVAQRRALDQRQYAELEGAHRLGIQNPSATAMVATLSGGRHAPHASRPAHHVFATRQQIIAALPRSSPEALSMLPGAEAGPTDELRRIARGEMVGGPPLPPATALASADPEQRVAEPRPRAVAAVPVPPQRPGTAVAAATAAAEASPVEANGLFGVFALAGVPGARPAAAPPAAQAPVVTGSVTPAPAPAGSGAAVIAQPGMMQRVLGVFGMSGAQ
jgi:murein L,D-transpeptidase YafK